MGLFDFLGGKRKAEEEQKKVDDMIMDGYLDQDAVLNPPKEEGEKSASLAASLPEGKGKDEFLTRLSMDVDRLKAQNEAFNQVRQLNEQRFQRLNEEIGELRRSILEREREISKLRVDSAKAIDMVNAVQPDQLMMEVKKEDMKLEKVAATGDANRKLIDGLVEEIKGIKNSISSFKGMDMIMKLNADVREELKEIKKTESVIERHSNKVESIFGSIQARFNEFAKLSAKVDVMDNSFNAAQKEIDAFRVRFNDMTNKKELQQLKSDTEGKLQSVDKYVMDLQAMNKEFKTLLDDASRAGSRKYYKIETKIDNRLSEIEARTKEVSSRLETIIALAHDEHMDAIRYYNRLLDSFNNVAEDFSIDQRIRNAFREITVKIAEEKDAAERRAELFRSGVK